ncbi:hypothetical protein K458DRAFT_432295 [Lentithecium fluviatile CBS 122367]|uniref:Uncharacterized protein n=1 Tax=Lentithecium fluviatile CBS 122367 TaxID=1168545 RepID=A0A6G1IZY9_9PLEO|nr:hypothetical protein K458DRAFT_432295 [Lentithecium fluviatile CBS 122367]
MTKMAPSTAFKGKGKIDNEGKLIGKLVEPYEAFSNAQEDAVLKNPLRFADVLNKRGTVVFVHPIETVKPPNLKISPCMATSSFILTVTLVIIDFTTDTARTILSLVLTCSFIKWISSHNGGTFPFIAGRTLPLTPMIKKNNDGKTLIDILSSTNIYFDTAISYLAQWLLVKDLGLPASHVLLAADFSFSMVGGESYKLGSTSTVYSKVFSDTELEGIQREVSLALFPRLRKSLRTPFRNSVRHVEKP